MFLAPNPDETDGQPQPDLTLEELTRALDEMQLHCAPSTFQSFVRSLRARGFRLDVTTWIT